MHMPVLRKSKDGTSELVLLDLNEVLYINIENRCIAYHTREETFHHIATLTELEEHLGEEGFDLLDKTNIVNMNQIRYLDEPHGNIYFDEEPDKHSKFASVALIKQKVLKNEIAAAIARNTGKTITFGHSKTAIHAHRAGIPIPKG
jgi:DNA-binding LytR/AlgR family response regulator